MTTIRDAVHAIRAQGDLPLCVVTFNTRDFPGEYVVRVHVIRCGERAGESNATTAHARGASRNEVRRHVPADMVRLARDPNDDAVIVESWI